MHTPTRLAVLVALLATTPILMSAQQTDAQRARTALFRAKSVPFEPGFRVFIVPDMEGMGSTVDTREVLAGNEGEAYRERSSPDYWDRFRALLTAEVNATIAGARAGGAASFAVNWSKA